MIRSLFNRARDPEERRVRAWCRQTLGITPGDPPLYRQALRHVSAVPDDRPDLPDNERLEFLGDAVLDAIIGDLLFTTYPDKGEGFLTRMRSKLVSRTQLNTLAKRIGIERVIESNLARPHESSVPGNALEALIGALFLDKGFERTRKVVVKLIKTHFDLSEIEKEDRDGKSRLLEWGQKRRKKVEFVVREEGGAGRGKHYVAEVHINGQVRGTGQGTSKKVAEQDAAQSAFRSMRSRKPHPAKAPAEKGGVVPRSQDAARRSARPPHRGPDGSPAKKDA
ncbi:MAG TPA: ribonuclease III [Flavobacteriales bacterium]|nr:ribonuclease III [Flavobacteriales bacterium]